MAFIWKKPSQNNLWPNHLFLHCHYHPFFFEDKRWSNLTNRWWLYSWFSNILILICCCRSIILPGIGQRWMDAENELIIHKTTTTNPKGHWTCCYYSNRRSWLLLLVKEFRNFSQCATGGPCADDTLVCNDAPLVDLLLHLPCFALQSAWFV